VSSAGGKDNLSRPTFARSLYGALKETLSDFRSSEGLMYHVDQVWGTLPAANVENPRPFSALMGHRLVRCCSTSDTAPAMTPERNARKRLRPFVFVWRAHLCPLSTVGLGRADRLPVYRPMIHPDPSSVKPQFPEDHSRIHIYPDGSLLVPLTCQWTMWKVKR
jgi:hypothetical protein